MIPSIEWTIDNKVKMIDQTLLPHKLEFLEFEDYRAVANSIKVMNIRGAPLKNGRSRWCNPEHKTYRF